MLSQTNNSGFVMPRNRRVPNSGPHWYPIPHKVYVIFKGTPYRFTNCLPLDEPRDEAFELDGVPKHVLAYWFELRGVVDVPDGHAKIWKFSVNYFHFRW